MLPLCYIFDIRTKHRKDKRSFRNYPTTSLNGRNYMKTIGGRLGAPVLIGAAVSVLAFAAGAQAQNQNSNGDSWQHDDSWQSGNPSPNDNPWQHNKAPRSPVLAVV